MRGLNFLGEMAKLFYLTVSLSASNCAQISFCVSPTVMSGGLSDLINPGLVVSMLE